MKALGDQQWLNEETPLSNASVARLATFPVTSLELPLQLLSLNSRTHAPELSFSELARSLKLLAGPLEHELITLYTAEAPINTIPADSYYPKHYLNVETVYRRSWQSRREWRGRVCSQ